MLCWQARLTGGRQSQTWPPLKHGRGHRLLAQVPAAATPADVASTARSSATCGLPLPVGTSSWALGALKGLCSRQASAHHSSFPHTAAPGKVDVAQEKS